jgi:hypothetical protein
LIAHERKLDQSLSRADAVSEALKKLDRDAK